MLRTKMFSLVALTSAFAAGLVLVGMTKTAEAGTGVTTDLCIATGIKFGSNTRGGCVYSGPDAPTLDAKVCWDGTTARLKGLTACPTGQRTYMAKFGEVINPLTLEVAAYAPLPDACTLMTCAEGNSINAPEIEDQPACCEGNNCEPIAAGAICDGDMGWCVDADDGSGDLICEPA